MSDVTGAVSVIRNVRRVLPHSVNEHFRKPVGIAAACLLLAAAIVVAWTVFPRSPRRYELLDSRFGPSAWEPVKLLEVFSWEYHADKRNPFGLGFPEFFDFQHQALLRLLEIQRQRFGRHVPSGATGGTYIDHSFAQVTERTRSQVLVLGTGTLDPCHYDRSSIHGPDPYWQMERFIFAPSGKLLDRQPHME